MITSEKAIDNARTNISIAWAQTANEIEYIGFEYVHITES